MDKTASNPLEQFLLLSKSAKGLASVELIKQALEAPGLYVFGELLDSDNIKEMKSGEHSKYYDLLELFAYGTYNDYNASTDQYPPLTSNQLTKLRHLTIVTLASNKKCLPYNILLNELGYNNLRQLEDLLIEVINTGIVGGKLDQKEQHMKVEHTMGRDVREEGVANILKVLNDCSTTCATVLAHIQELASQADQAREECNTQMQDVDKEIQKMKSSLKTSTNTQQQQQHQQHHDNNEDHLSVDLSSSSDKSSAKKGKIKLGIKSSQSSNSFSSPKLPK